MFSKVNIKNINKIDLLKKFNNIKVPKTTVQNENTDNEIDYSNTVYETNKNNIKSIINSKTYLSGVEFSEKIKTLKPYSKEYYDAYLDYRINQSGGYGTRESVVASAKYLSEEYTVNGNNLPYFWGGKRLEKGVDESWGSLKTIAGSGTSDQPLGQQFPYGLDCSGFVSWTLYNSGYDIDVYYSDGIVSHCFSKGGIDHQLDNNIFNDVEIKAGDIIYRDIGDDDHIGIITDCDYDNNTITFAEENGSKGLISNKLSFEEFKDKYINSNLKFTGIISMENYYSNVDNLIK